MNEMNALKELHFARYDSRQVAIRSELEATRSAFHHRLNTAVKMGWDQKSPSSAWTVGQILFHLTWALEYLPEEVRRACLGKGMFNLPKRLSDTMSYWYIRWLARTLTPAEIGRRYDRAMDASLALLAILPEDAWQVGANFYGEGFHTVEDLFHVPVRHLAEHTAGL